MTINGAITILKRHNEYLKRYNKWDFNEPIEAIDTVLSHINSVKKIGLDDSLLEQSIESADNQENISNKKDKMYTEKDMIEFAEWISLSLWRFYKKRNVWISYGMQRQAIINDLLKLWNKEKEKKRYE